jgi:hypothetical protein
MAKDPGEQGYSHSRCSFPRGDGTLGHPGQLHTRRNTKSLHDVNSNMLGDFIFGFRFPFT